MGKCTLYEFIVDIGGIRVYIYGRDREVFAVSFLENESVRKRLSDDFEIRPGSPEDPIYKAFTEYAKTGSISDIRPNHQWGTEFQRRVWSAIYDIPCGETTTYGGIAAAIGKPGAYRAVGQATGANPIPILIPCHRVLAKTGLGGFGSRPGIKRILLNIEGLELREKK